MANTDLEEIRSYWQRKYPNISIILYPNDNGIKYCGRMMTSSSAVDLQANTIGDLINQGENFLRQLPR